MKSIGLNCIRNDSVGLDKISPKTFLNYGYLNKLKKSIGNLKVNLVLININLSAIQQRNLENELNCKVLDRTSLILEIFGSRAKSNEGKLSVMLASLQFQKADL